MKLHRLLYLLVISIIIFTGCNLNRYNKEVNPFTISTFNSIGIYWSPIEGTISRDVIVNFREKGEKEWNSALSLKYNTIERTNIEIADYRGSIVNLLSGKEYEISFLLENSEKPTIITASTWSEEFPIGSTVIPKNLTTQYDINKSGTKTGYRLIDGTGLTIDVNNGSESCINITANYVIIRGFKLVNGKKYAIKLNNCHNVIIEDCDISNWGSLKNEFATNNEGAIYSESKELKSIVVQRCRIHHPRYDANSWAEFNSNAKSATNQPQGQQGITFKNSIGNHVFRYNEFWSDEEHKFSDILGSCEDNVLNGFPGSDSDIYGNYFGDCWDNVIELNGGNSNVRIWNNYMENIYVGIAATSTTIGPLYIWNNVVGNSFSPSGSQFWEYGLFVRMENSQNGHKYFFNNTILQPNGMGVGGIGTVENFNLILENCTARNNILHVREGTVNSISRNKLSQNIDFDFDLINTGYPNGQEINGINDKPIYSEYSGFNFNTMTGNFQLLKESSGYQAGKVIPNFSIGFLGERPDVGAHQFGQPDIQYGVRAGLRDYLGENSEISESKIIDTY